MAEVLSDREIALRLGDLFRQARINLGLNLDDVSQRLEAQFGVDKGISTSNIQRLERGLVAKPAWVDVLKLAAYYHLPVSQLLETTGIGVPGTSSRLTPMQRELRTLTEQLLSHQVADETLSYVLVIGQVTLKNALERAAQNG